MLIIVPKIISFHAAVVLALFFQFIQIVFDKVIDYNIRITILTIFSLLVILFDVVKFPNDPCLGEDPFGRVSLFVFIMITT